MMSPFPFPTRIKAKSVVRGDILFYMGMDRLVGEVLLEGSSVRLKLRDGVVINLHSDKIVQVKRG